MLLALLAESRWARTDPAEPPPMMMKSYTFGTFGASLCFYPGRVAQLRPCVTPVVANAGMYDYALPQVRPNGLSIGRTFMSKFLRIGVHQKNVSGYTSKAWCIRRVGSQVFLKWGAVEVLGAGDGRKVSWTRFQVKTIRCGTAQRANAYVKAAIVKRRNHRYEPLTGSIAIRRRSAAGSPELK